MTTTQFYLVVQTDPQQFEDKVNQKLQEGFTLQGHHYCVTVDMGPYYKLQYSQGMIKTSDQATNP